MTVKTGSTTAGSSSTPSTTVKSMGATSSTTAKTTGTTSSITPKTSQSVSSTTPNIYSGTGISSETIKDISGEQNIKNMLNVLNRDLEESVIYKVNDMLDRTLSVTDSVRVFDFKLDNPLMSLEYYADIKGTKGDGQIRAEFAQDILDMMKQVPSLDNIAINAGESGSAIAVREGQLWIEYTSGGATTKVNMTKMMSGICNVVYENTQILNEDKNGKIEATVGMEINVMLDNKTSSKFVADYEVAYDTYLKGYAHRVEQASKVELEGEEYIEENNKTFIDKLEYYGEKIMKAGAVIALAGFATYFFGPYGAAATGTLESFIK